MGCGMGWQNIFSHGSSHSRGVCVLLNPHSTFHLRRVEADTEGRFLIVKVTIDEECFFITNLYAPTDYRDQDSFICRLSKQLISNTDTSKVAISGDWNTTLNPIDKRGGQPWKATSYTPNANMADHSVGARDEYESEASEASMFCFDKCFL